MSFLERLLGGHRGGHGNRDYGGHHGNRGGHDGWSTPQQGPMNAPAQPCPKCHAPTTLGARFCAQCGASTQAAPCSGCSATLQPGAKFCGQCGKPANFGAGGA